MGNSKNQIFKCRLQNKLSGIRPSNYISHFEMPCVCSMCGLPLIGSAEQYKRYLVKMHLNDNCALKLYIVKSQKPQKTGGNSRKSEK